MALAFSLLLLGLCSSRCFRHGGPVFVVVERRMRKEGRGKGIYM